MRAAVHDLQDAMLACHNARLSHDSDAASGFCMRGDALDLGKREFGGEPNGARPMFFHGANAGEVMHRQTAANLCRGPDKMGE